MAFVMNARRGAVAAPKSVLRGGEGAECRALGTGVAFVMNGRR